MIEQILQKLEMSIELSTDNYNRDFCVTDYDESLKAAQAIQALSDTYLRLKCHQSLYEDDSKTKSGLIEED